MVNLELRLDGETVAKLEIDATQLSRLLPSTMHVPMVHPSVPLSSPMTKAQAQQLLSRVDTNCADFLERLAADRGMLTWGETKALFEVRNWEAFATGPENRSRAKFAMSCTTSRPASSGGSITNGKSATKAGTRHSSCTSTARL